MTSGPSHDPGAAGHAAQDAARSMPPFDAGSSIARALFHQSPFSSVIYDSEGRVLAINAAFTRLMGLTPADLKPEYSILHDPQLESAGVLPLIRKAFDGETVQLPIVRYDAARYGGVSGPTWTQGHLYPVRDDAGRVMQVVLVHVDLTARVVAEEALEAGRHELASAQRRLGAILNAVMNGITVQAVDGSLVYANDSAARFLGFASAAELIATPLTFVTERFEMLTEDGAPLPHSELPGRRAAAGEPAPEKLIRYRVRRTGEERYSLVSARAIPAAPGETPLVVNVFEDVTVRMEHQRELEETTARLRELTLEQESTLEELSARSDESEEARIEAEWAQEQWHFLAEASRILADSLEVESTLSTVAKLAVPRIADWCIVHVAAEDGNVRRIEAAHADPERVASFREFDRDFGSDPALVAVQRVMATAQSELFARLGEDTLAAWARDDVHLRRLRALDLYSAMVVPLNAGNRVLGAITLVSAGSRRRYDREDLAFAESLAGRAAVAMHTAELYQTAQHANRAKADFLAVMSHELRTPLNAILGYSDLLTEGISGSLNARQQEQLTRIAQSARHLTDLINAILAFARIEAGRDVVRVSSFDIADVAREALAFIAPAAAKKGLSLESKIDSAPTRSDVAKIRQILLNLLSNAVKFTSRGVVRLTVATRPGWCDLRVSDTGIGISAEDQARVWEPFTQLEASLTRRAGGTGLGLPVSLNLATLLGGSIELDSTPGGGSTFTLRLPLDPG